MPERDDLRETPSSEGADEAALAIVARHALHDEELVAALAAGALDGDDDADERARALGLVDRCPACRAVRDDVAAIATATRYEARGAIRAPRDFRLTVDDAHRLGGTVVSQGAFARFWRTLLGIARPVGASLAALGLVGLMVGSAVLGAMGGAAGAAPAGDTGSTLGAAANPTTVAGAEASMAIENGPVAPPKASDRTAADFNTPGSRDALGPGFGAWLLGLSVLALILGVVLFLAGVRAARGRTTRTGSA